MIKALLWAISLLFFNLIIYFYDRKIYPKFHKFINNILFLIFPSLTTTLTRDWGCMKAIYYITMGVVLFISVPLAFIAPSYAEGPLFFIGLYFGGLIIFSIIGYRLMFKFFDRHRKNDVSENQERFEQFLKESK